MASRLLTVHGVAGFHSVHRDQVVTDGAEVKWVGVCLRSHEPHDSDHPWRWSRATVNKTAPGIGMVPCSRVGQWRVQQFALGLQPELYFVAVFPAAGEVEIVGAPGDVMNRYRL
jgi:hypothetical protein